MATNPAAVLEAALAARGIQTIAPDDGGARQVGFASATTPVVAPAAPAAPSPTALSPSPLPQPPGSEPAAPAPPVLTPEQVQELARQNAAQPPAAPAPPAAPGAPAPDPLLQRLTEKFGPEAAQIMVAQIKGTAALHQRLDTVLDRIAAPPPPPPFDVTADPQVKFHSDRIASIDSDLADVEKTISTAVQEAHRLNAKISPLLGKIEAYREAGASEQLGRAESELSRLQASYETLRQEWRHADAEAKSLRRTKTEEVFKRDQAVARATSNHQQSIVDAAADEDAEKKSRTETNSEFDAAGLKHATRYGISFTPELRADLVDRFGRYVNALPREERREKVNLDAFIGSQLDAMAQTWGITPKADFTQHSREAAAAALLPRPTLPAPPSSIPAAPSTWEALPVDQQAQGARDHARSVLMRR